MYITNLQWYVLHNSTKLGNKTNRVIITIWNVKYFNDENYSDYDLCGKPCRVEMLTLSLSAINNT